MIDAHAHLHEIADVEAALRRAAAVGVERIIAVGMDLVANETTLALGRRFPQIISPAIGYHPWSIKVEEIEANLAFIEAHLAGCVALGEVGLDYKVKIKKPVQQQVFARLLTIAAGAGRPVIVHTRFSHPRAHRMVREAGVPRAVFHWYSGPLEVLRRILDDGFLISATPALSYSPPHREAVIFAPLERILIETDAPVTYQGRASEPADLIVTARELSRLKGLDRELVQEVTRRTARRFFDL
jgi:TatD DNase family protein